MGEGSLFASRDLNQKTMHVLPFTRWIRDTKGLLPRGRGPRGHRVGNPPWWGPP